MMSIRSDLTLREILSAGKDTRVIPVSTDDRLVIGIVPKSEKKVKTKEINLQSCPASVVTNEILLAGQKLVSFCLIHLFFLHQKIKLWLSNLCYQLDYGDEYSLASVFCFSIILEV
jgi:hypothetical protein